MSDCCDAPGPDGPFDLIVVGAGSAGFSAAITAADAGARVALVGHGTIGGTCVNAGCIPSKTLVRAAGALYQARHAGRFEGLRAHAHLADWGALIRQKDALVADLRQAKYADLLPHHEGITYVEGRARLVDQGVVAGDVHLPSKRTIITTGARPAIPRIDGIEDVLVLTSTTALDLQAPPGSLVVVGGGFIGVEMAQMFGRLGVEVTIVCRRRLLPDVDADVAGALAGYLEDEGIRVVSGVTYRTVRGTAGGVVLEALDADGREARLAAERLLVATGRTPNTEGLGLAEAGVAVDAEGAIVVDERMRTSRTGVYAAGDVTGRDQFVYMAAYGAKVAALNALDGDARTYDRRVLPWVVFTDPQVAAVGLTESDARALGHDVESAVLPLVHLPRALAARDTRGLVKLTADTKTGRLLGAQILAPEGGDSIQTAALAIRHGMTVHELADTIAPYLTTVEGLRLAAEAFRTDVTQLSCCAG